MNVRNNGGDTPPLTSRKLCTPGSRIEMIEDDLVHALVYRPTLDQRLAKLAVKIGLCVVHGIT